MIGSAVGGGFDFYGRAVGRYMSKYLPGNPTVVPQNLPGAGSFNAAARVAITAPQDGTYIGAIQPTAILDPVLGDPSKGAKRLVAANVRARALTADMLFTGLKRQTKRPLPVRVFRESRQSSRNTAH